MEAVLWLIKRVYFFFGSPGILASSVKISTVLEILLFTQDGAQI